MEEIEESFKVWLSTIKPEEVTLKDAYYAGWEDGEEYISTLHDPPKDW